MIVDTGNSFVITDLRSANGVDVADQRIRTSATLADGDRICICGHEFTFEIGARAEDSTSRTSGLLPGAGESP